MKAVKQRAGSKGGKQNTPEQQAARRKTIYLALVKRYPNSVKVRQKLRALGAGKTVENG